MSLWLWPRNPKFNRSHLLIMTNHHTKLEYPWAMSSLVIDRTSFVYEPTNRPTYRHVRSNIPPLLRIIKPNVYLILQYITLTDVNYHYFLRQYCYNCIPPERKQKTNYRYLNHSKLCPVLSCYIIKVVCKQVFEWVKDIKNYF